MELILLVPLFLTTLLTLIFLKPFLKQTTTKLNLPPSPWRLPVIGNLHQLSLHPHRSLRALSFRYGPLMLLHFGSAPFLVVSSTDTAREIMKTHDLKFANRPKTKRINQILNGGRDVFFSSYGEYWRQMKLVCVVHLLGKTMVRSFEKVREAEINTMTEKLEKASSSSSPVNLSKLIKNMLSDIMSRICLGKKYNSEEGTLDIATMFKTFAEIVSEFHVGEYIPSLAWIDKIRGLHNKLVKVNKEFDDFMERVLQEHAGEDRKIFDFVDMLLKIQREKPTGLEFDKKDLKLIIFDMLGAGMTTTATTVEWIMTELMRHPECMKKLKDDILSGSRHNSYVSEEEVATMNYLKAVVKEALRLHPPIPLLVTRLLSEDVIVNGYNIASGTQVMINAWAIQRDIPIWGSDAEEFKPERHLHSPVDYQGQDFKYIPFGSGRRLCPGIGFASALVEVTLANLVKRFDFIVGVGPHVDDNKPDVAEVFGLEVGRKFPLIVYPSVSFTM